MKIVKKPKTYEDIVAMSNVRGQNVVNPKRLPFSFYFSGKGSNSHGIRVKPVWNSQSMRISKAGNLELSGDWKYTPSQYDKHISSAQIDLMKQFFKDYIVIFCLVWNEQVDDPIAADFFEGRISLQEFIGSIDFYPEYVEDLNKIQTVQQLEDFCRVNDLTKMYGN